MPRTGTLPTVLTGVFMTILDFFIVNVAIPATRQVGGALGVGIVGIVFYDGLSGGVTQAFQHGVVYLIMITLAIAGLVQLLPRTTVKA
ncbi:hypothetical protein [Streptosporangium sp. NPDC000396]|uniref:hypothetical protein n=1 Tax=Streptosporangium sp. NPDC000396 TaxID=3366185 RepID=UPI00367FE54E